MLYILQQKNDKGNYYHIKENNNYDSLLENSYNILDDAKQSHHNIYIRIVDEKGEALFDGECNSGRISFSGRIPFC